MEKAYRFAVNSHQVRKRFPVSDITHPWSVILAGAELDMDTIAGLLHDVVEDTDVTLKKLQQFGDDIAMLDG